MRALAIIFCLFSYMPMYALQCDQTPGLADSHVLALSWHAGFCKTTPKAGYKPECLNIKASDYQASHLSLHGLWPNQNQCGTHYGFCQSHELSTFCDYPPVLLTESTANTLRRYMFSYQQNSCLERHEWQKHGLCQLQDSDHYFQLALSLVEQVDNSALGRFINQNVGKKVSKSDLNVALVDTFGAQYRNRIYLGCSQGVLVDIYINLPASMTDNTSIQSLIKQAPPIGISDSCGKNINIIRVKT